MNKSVEVVHDAILNSANAVAKALVPSKDKEGLIAELERRIAKGFGKFVCILGGLVNMAITAGTVYAGIYVATYACSVALPALIVVCALGGAIEGGFIGSRVAEHYKEWISKKVGTKNPVIFGSVTLGAVGFLLGGVGSFISLRALSAVDAAPTLGQGVVEGGGGKVFYLGFSALAEGIGASFFLVGNAFIEAANKDDAEKNEFYKLFAIHPIKTLALGCYHLIEETKNFLTNAVYKNQDSGEIELQEIKIRP